MVGMLQSGKMSFSETLLALVGKKRMKCLCMAICFLLRMMAYPSDQFSRSCLSPMQNTVPNSPQQRCINCIADAICFVQYQMLTLAIKIEAACSFTASEFEHLPCYNR